MEALKNVAESITVNNHSEVAKTLGAGMMAMAFMGYERHIHNGSDGFRSELIAGGQGAGVYGHILGMAGAFLNGFAGMAVGVHSAAFDRLQKLWGTKQGAAEVAGNEAGLKVGRRMWNFINGTSRDKDKLTADLKSILCG